jgi:hypothetical protein
LARSRLPTPDPTLGLIPFSAVRRELGNYRITNESDLVLDSYFLLVEDAGSAAQRAARALSAQPNIALPPTFTRALDDGVGNVMYLPDGLRRSTDFQLFGITDQQFSRIRIRGQMDERSARLRDLEPSQQAACPDGPCVAWGESCGTDCMCMKFEVDRDQFAEDALSTNFLRGAGRTYELRCVKI